MPKLLTNDIKQCQNSGRIEALLSNLSSRRMKNILFLGLGLLAVLGGLFVYEGQRTGINPFSATIARLFENDTIKVGAPIGLTGICAQWGEDELKAIQLAVEEANTSDGVNGKQIELIVEDSQCEPRGAVNAIIKLISVNKVKALIGTTWGDSFQAAFTVSEPRQIVAVSPSTVLEVLEKNQLPITHTFSTWYPAQSEMEVLAAYIQETNVKTVALVHDNDTYGSVMAETFQNSTQSRGIEISKDFTVSIGHDDFRATITELKSIRPDAVFLSAQSSEVRAKFLKQAKELNFGIQIYSSSDMEDATLLDEFGNTMDGLIYARPEITGDYDSFESKFKTRYERIPLGPSSANAYDATRVVIEALKKHYRDNVTLVQAVTETDMPGTVVKNLKFDDHHQLSGFEYQIKTIRNGQFVVIE